MKIAIVGAGPRGLLVMANLIHNFKSSQIKHLQIQLFDRYPIGGRVWRTIQYRYLKMDTISQQITMFPLKSKEPNLYQWTQREAPNYIKQKHYPRTKLLLRLVHQQDPNYYAPRCIFGIYLQWFYDQAIKHLPKGITVQKINHFAYDVQPAKPGYQIKIEDGETFSADKVVMNLGQQVNKPSGQELQLGIYARVNQLLYYPIGYVEEKNMKLIEPCKPILVRGLGLNFMDTMNVLTLSRGGRYITQRDGSLVYKPSGREPKIIAGSRRGLPYYCKAVNQKVNGKHPRPYFLSKESVKKHAQNGKLAYGQFICLLKLDMDLIYYTKLIKRDYPRYDARQFKQRFLKTHRHQQVIKSYHFKSQDILNLSRLLHPIDETKVASVRQYQKIVVQWLNTVIREALSGNVKSPLTAAISTLRDFRDPIRWIVNNHYFTADDYTQKYLSHFNTINSLLVMGPPVTDMNRLRALIQAHIVTILPAGMTVKSAKGCFIGYSKRCPHPKFIAQMMLEARNPIPRASLTIGPLLRNLNAHGLISKPTYTLTNHKKVTLDSINVKNDSDQLIGKDGKLEPNLYTWGLSTEGIHWCTPNAPHPSGHDSNLWAANRIAKDLLGLPHPKFNLM